MLHLSLYALLLVAFFCFFFWHKTDIFKVIIRLIHKNSLLYYHTTFSLVIEVITHTHIYIYIYIILIHMYKLILNIQ